MKPESLYLSAEGRPQRLAHHSPSTASALMGADVTRRGKQTDRLKGPPPCRPSRRQNKGATHEPPLEGGSEREREAAPGAPLSEPPTPRTTLPTCTRTREGDGLPFETSVAGREEVEVGKGPEPKACHRPWKNPSAFGVGAHRPAPATAFIM